MHPASSKPPLFHLWLPNLFEFKGGIQVYSEFWLKALQSLGTQVSYEVFLKHDTRLPNDFSCPPNAGFHFSGNWPLSVRTPAFASQLLGWGLWQRPQLIMVNHLNFAVAAYGLKRLTGVPYWIAVYGMECWNVQKPALQNALRHADKIISISGYTRDRLLQEQNLNPSQFLLLPCTLEADRWSIAPKPAHLLARYGLKPEQPVILTVSRLAGVGRYKGYDRILEALPQIRQVIPDVHYILAGKGDDRPRIEQLIAQLQLQDCVTLAGFVPDEELGDYYNLCDVFAMPSKREGFGIVYIEALACGKPVLGGNRDGAIDALCHGELGVLVDPDDTHAIAKALIEILQKTYPNPLIYQPELLRQKAIATFGFDRFQQTLTHYLGFNLKG
jgi:glycosyltransferase involved in cell wall biosynthesis